MEDTVSLILKLPRNIDVTPESAQTFLASLLGINKRGFYHKLLRKNAKNFALEIILKDQGIYFQITGHTELISFIESQLQSAYPLITIAKNKAFVINQGFNVSKLILKNGNYYPIKTYTDFKDVDPLSSILTVLSKSNPADIAAIQYSLLGVSSSWQAMGEKYASHGTKKEDGTYSPRTDMQVIKDKIKSPGFKVSIKIASNNSSLLQQLSQSFNVFMRPDGNSFTSKKPFVLRKNKLTNDFNSRSASDGQILNIEEIATLWHMPSVKIKTQSIAWGITVLSEPPANLPVAGETADAERQHVNFFARTLFKNKDVVFGVKDVDRRRHIWAMGKTGTGKSTLIANMVIDDLKKGRGLAVIDPHGDLSETLLDYIPKNRINDLIYFNPADRDYPVVINPLEVTNKEEAELVVSGIVSIFNKIFGFSWGPRLEYILRNSLLTLSEVPDSTLKDIPLLLTNSSFRSKVVQKIKDETLKSFWMDEFEKMPPNLQKEAISPILNKVGQFVTSPMIRSVIGFPKSSISLDDVMNEGKIVIANLSQGRMGEDNAMLMGAMLITKLQLAAMKRVDKPEAERRDFYLYVDEFQNFATNSFIKILSEARKYRLNLMLANQYMAQVPVEVQKAIFGNTGTLISFSAGAEDANILFKEYAEVFTQNDLINLANYQIAIKLMIDGHSQRPFLATTLPLPLSKNQNKEKVIKQSREHWGRKINGR